VRFVREKTLLEAIAFVLTENVLARISSASAWPECWQIISFDDPRTLSYSTSARLQDSARRRISRLTYVKQNA